MHVPYFRSDANPTDVRAQLDSYYRWLDMTKQVRIELAQQGASLRERIVAAAFQHDVEQAIRTAHRWLARHARRGAGRSPALMGHGCPALDSAVGPALVRATADIT
jgi:hypothetical protein